MGLYRIGEDITWLARDLVHRPSGSTGISMSEPMWQVRLVTAPPGAEEMQGAPDTPAVAGTLLIGDGRLRGSLWGVMHTIRGSLPLDALHLVGPGMHHLYLSQFPAARTETLDAAVPQDHPFFPAPTTIWSRTIGALGGEAVWRRLVGLQVAVIGVGRTGSLVVTTLTRLGLRTLSLIDPDIVEAHNIGEMDGVIHHGTAPRERLCAEPLSRGRPDGRELVGADDGRNIG